MVPHLQSAHVHCEELMQPWQVQSAHVGQGNVMVVMVGCCLNGEGERLLSLREGKCV